MLLRRLPTLSDDQRDILTGLFVKAAAETIAVVVVLWVLASIVVGSVVLGRWVGGLG